MSRPTWKKFCQVLLLHPVYQHPDMRVVHDPEGLFCNPRDIKERPLKGPLGFYRGFMRLYKGYIRVVQGIRIRRPSYCPLSNPFWGLVREFITSLTKEDGFLIMVISIKFPHKNPALNPKTRTTTACRGLFCRLQSLLVLANPTEKAEAGFAETITWRLYTLITPSIPNRTSVRASKIATCVYHPCLLIECVFFSVAF